MAPAPADPCRGKTPYPSHAVATNAAELHDWIHPTCPGLDTYECGDHWHNGHPLYTAAPDYSATEFTAKVYRTSDGQWAYAMFTHGRSLESGASRTLAEAQQHVRRVYAEVEEAAR